jgi:hypothetical protein
MIMKRGTTVTWLGTIMVAKKAMKITFFPGKRRRAKAKAAHDPNNSCAAVMRVASLRLLKKNRG